MEYDGRLGREQYGRLGAITAKTSPIPVQTATSGRSIASTTSGRPAIASATRGRMLIASATSERRHNTSTSATILSTNTSTILERESRAGLRGKRRREK
jgi:hypothetical protein